MTATLQRKLSDSKAARWTALVIVSLTMMAGYFFTDVMSAHKPPMPGLVAVFGNEIGRASCRERV